MIYSSKRIEIAHNIVYVPFSAIPGIRCEETAEGRNCENQSEPFVSSCREGRIGWEVGDITIVGQRSLLDWEVEFLGEGGGEFGYYALKMRY